MPLTRDAIPVEQGELPLTIARAGGAGAAILIVPSVFGIGPDLEAQMEELAADASVVVAIDPFFRDDPGHVPYDRRDRVNARLQGLDRERAARDVRAAIGWLRARDGVRSLVMLGICFGGPFALVAAADGLVDGVATWHGTRMEAFLDRAGEMRVPMRLHFGGADPFVPMEAVEAVRAAFAGRDDVRLAVHDGATHGFSHRGSPRSYDAPAEQAGMASLRDLSAQLGSLPERRGFRT
jgi:carboxymethylenebutenolidase